MSRCLLQSWRPTHLCSCAAIAPACRAGQAQPPIGSDPNEEKESLADMLPDWVGYGFLYGVSAVPVIIALSAVAVLFYNSLQ